jgi:hypothetical protein
LALFPVFLLLLQNLDTAAGLIHYSNQIEKELATVKSLPSDAECDAQIARLQAEVLFLIFPHPLFSHLCPSVCLSVCL